MLWVAGRTYYFGKAVVSFPVVASHAGVQGKIAEQGYLRLRIERINVIFALEIRIWTGLRPGFVQLLRFVVGWSASSWRNAPPKVIRCFSNRGKESCTSVLYI